VSGLTRRRFLAGAGAAVAAAAAAGSGVSTWLASGASATTRPRLRAGDLGGRRDRTLVVVELGGGNDGLNTVVPEGSGVYHDLRPTLAVSAPLDLDGSVGLHPSLELLAARYRRGDVALVEGVGVPDPDLSHFQSLATWWSGDPKRPTSSGWLGRYLDGTVGFDDPLAGLAIGTGPAPALLGNRSFSTSVADATGLTPRLPAWVGDPGTLLSEWPALLARHDDGALGRAVKAMRATQDAQRRLGVMLGTAARGTVTTGTATAARGGVATSLELAARFVTAAEPPRVVYVSVTGDYDTHQGQAARHATLLAQLDAGIEAFFSLLEQRGVAERAVIMTVSDFGRRARENGSGTDHGTAAAHLLVGPGVQGGRHGSPPALDRLDDDGNLAHTVDFRAMYATVLEQWLGVDAEAVLGGRFAALPVFG
jgi:uncharacterized protein (DUF1501 family)